MVVLVCISKYALPMASSGLRGRGDDRKKGQLDKDPWRRIAPPIKDRYCFVSYRWIGIDYNVTPMSSDTVDSIKSLKIINFLACHQQIASHSEKKTTSRD